MKNGNEARDVLGDSRKRYRARGHGDRKILDRVINQSDFMIRYRVHWKKKTWHCSSNFCLVKSATRLLCLYLLFFTNNGSFTFFLSFCIYLFVYWFINLSWFCLFFSFSAPVHHPGTYTKTSSYESCWMVWADFEKILTIQCIRKGCQSLLLKL